MHKKKLIINTVANWAGHGLNVLIGFFLTPYLVHSLGDADYGLWAIMASVSGYMSLLDCLGSSLTRYVSQYTKLKNHQKLSSVSSSGLVVYLGLGIILIAASLSLGYLLVGALNISQAKGDLVRVLLVITAVSVSVFLLNGVFRGILNGLLRYDLENLIQVAAGLIKAGLIFFLLYFDYGLIEISLCILLSHCFVFMASLFVIKRYYGHIEFKIKYVTAESSKQIINYGKYTLLNMIANQVMYYTDSFVIAGIMSVASVTFYSVAWGIVEYLKQFCYSFARVFFPVISEYAAVSDYKKICEIMNNGTRYMLLLNLPLSMSIICFGKPFIALWMGEKYAQTGYSILTVLLVAEIIRIPQMIGVSVLFGISKHKVLSIANTAAGVINLIISILLANRFGLVGVAVGTAFPQILLYGMFLPYYTNRLLGQTLRDYLKSTWVPVFLPGIVAILSFSCVFTFLPSETYGDLVVNTLLAILPYLCAAYIFSLGIEERAAINTRILRYLNWVRNISLIKIRQSN